MTAEHDCTCAYCGEPIEPFARTTWHRVIGWERHAGRRASGAHGGSDIALREPRDEYAHDDCIRLAKRGISPLQPGLW